MANIQEEITGQVWNLFLKFLGTGSEFVYQIAHEGNVALKQGEDFVKNLLVAIINKQKERGELVDATAQMLSRVEKGESIKTMLFAEEETAELTNYFKDKNILFNIIDTPNDDTNVFMFMSNDTQKVQDVIALWQAEKGLVSELNPDLFLENFAQEGVGTISGLDRADLEVFRTYAHKNNLVFTSTPTEEPNKYLIVYDPKDTSVAKKTMASTLWAFSGTRGAKYKEQIEIHLKNRQAINRSLLEGEKEFYIVNSKSPDKYIYLTANDLTYFKNSKEVMTIARNSGDFIDRALRIVDGMTRPIMLDKDTFERLSTQENIDNKTIKDAVLEITKDVPDLNDLMALQNEQNEKLELIQSKMSLDDENTAGFWIYDDSIDFAAGGSYEDIEDLDEQTKLDVEAAKERALQYKFHEFAANDNRNIDYFIAQAMKYQKESQQKQHSKDEIDR